MQRPEINSSGYPNHVTGRKTGFATPRTVAFLIVVIAALVYLLVAMPATVGAMLPFGILLLCPLMHLFMHHGHGGQSDHRH